MEKFDKSNPYNKNVQPSNPNKKAAIVLVFFFFIAIFFVIKCSFSGEEKVDSKNKHEKFDALVQVQDYVKSKLKAPSTTEFEGGTEGVTKINDTTFTVIGTVDSQNSFGAMLRANYSCKIIFHPKNDTYSIEDFILE